MRAAIYARYSSENQRPESIDDQVSSCRKLAVERGYVVSDEHIYSDMAVSGARKDRAGLAALLAASECGCFEVILVDDLSRLARDNYLMLSILAELRFRGIRVLSVADGLDSEDEEATMGIQIRGIFNELQLRDLKKKTLRGQIGQKERGFSVGERTYGYKSFPVGTTRMDKKGRPRPEGYKMEIYPREAGVVLRIFHEFADGRALTSIVRRLNLENIPGRFNHSKGWSPATVSRILQNEKYLGRWVWNRMESRRDPRTGRRRKFPKPESQWIVHVDDTLRIVPQSVWGQVQKRFEKLRKTWPHRKGQRGFESQQGGRVEHYPTHLLSGSMICGICGSAIALASGKSGGYYGCLGATKGACENRLLVRRTLTERVVLAAVREKLVSAENLHYVLKRVEKEIARACVDMPEKIRLMEAEVRAEERRVSNFVEFIGTGQGSKALAHALVQSERNVEELRAGLMQLRHSQVSAFKAPPKEWIEEKMTTMQKTLEQRTQRSALLLRNLLGKISLEPTRGDIGRPYFRATSQLQVLALLEQNSESPEPGSNSFKWWRRGESNPRPKAPKSKLPSDKE